MAYVTHKEIDDNRGAEIGEDGVVTRRRAWYFIYDSHQTDAKTVVDDFSTRTGIRRYTTYVGADGATDPTCRAVSLTAEQSTDFGKWIVRAVYTSGRAGSSGGSATPRQNRERAEMARRGLESGGQEQPDPDPRNRPPSIQWGSQEYEEVVQYAADDGELPIQNSAFERFVPAPTRLFTFRTLTIERNEAIDWYTARGTATFENTVNANEFYLFPPLSVLCKSITAVIDVEGEFAFWAVTYLFHIRLDEITRPAGFGPWDHRILDAGYRERIDGRLEEILTKTGAAPSSPVPLDGNGRKLPAGAPFVFRNYVRYKRKDFTSLGL